MTAALGKISKDYKNLNLHESEETMEAGVTLISKVCEHLPSWCLKKIYSRDCIVENDESPQRRKPQLDL